MVCTQSASKYSSQDHDYGVEVGRDKLVLRHFLSACHGALSVEDFEMLNDLMPFPYPLGCSGGLNMLMLLAIPCEIRYTCPPNSLVFLLFFWEFNVQPVIQ